MKKIMVALCALVVACMASPLAASGATAQTTYIASGSVYHNGYTTVSLKDYKMTAKSAAGKATVLMSGIDQEKNLSFYVRGTTTYCSETPLESADYANDPGSQKLYCVKTNGTKTRITEGVGDIIGGYGEDIITFRRDSGTVSRIHAGSSNIICKTLFSAGGPVTLFAGKLYYFNKAYSLSTAKTTKFTFKNMVSTKNYLYYVSGSDNLVRMNASGEKKYLAKNVKGVFGGNDNGNAIFSKSSKTGMNYYRVNSKGTVCRLASQAAVLKAAGINRASELRAVLVNGKVCIGVYDNVANNAAIVSVANTGGTPKVIAKTDMLKSMAAYGRVLYYTGGGNDDFQYVYYKAIVIR
jgi:hypothetical protein